jgi:hypothetical protein
VGNLSWIRAYHIGVFADTPPLDLLTSNDLGVTLLDVDEQQFFDIQPLRRGQVARGKLAPVRVTGPMRLPDAAGQGVVRHISGEVVTHLVAHRSGFLLIRPTIRFDRLQVEGGLSAPALHTLERGVWAMASDLTWQLSEIELRGYVRNYMNYVFLDLFTQWSGEKPSRRQLAEWSVEEKHGCERLHRLVAEGRLEHPFPVSFGTDVQVAMARRPDESIADWNARAAELAWEIMRPSTGAVDTTPLDLESDARSVAWFMDESVSLVVCADARLDPDMDVLDPDRAQLNEFLALRRGGLTSVQRITQRVITERQGISRRQLARWQYLVATLTDDYVLHARLGRLLEPVKLSFARDPRLRDINDLERQVRSNLEWFQARIEAAGQWTGGLIGAAVGAAALAFSLTEPVRLVIGTVTSTPVAEVGDRHGPLLAGAVLAVVLLAFSLSFLLVKRLSDTLRPLARRRSVRLARPRRPVRKANGRRSPGPPAPRTPSEPAQTR